MRRGQNKVMEKKYLIIGGIVILLLGTFFLFGSKEKPNDDTAEEVITPVSSFTHAHGLALDITDPNKVYIATHEGLYLLVDDKDLYRIGNARDDLMGFSAHPTEVNTFFSSGHPSRGGNIGFQQTTDGGVTWKRISAGLGGPVDFHAMAVSQANPNIIYGFYSGKMQRSRDGGISWEYASGAIAPLSLSPDYTNENVVYAGTQNGVWVSKDQGNTWSNVSDELTGGMVSVFAIHPDDKKYALAFPQKLGGLGKSMDGGISWEKIDENFGNETVLYLAFSKADLDIAYLLTDKHSVYKSMDRGNIWAKIR